MGMKRINRRKEVETSANLAISGFVSLIVAVLLTMVKPELAHNPLASSLVVAIPVFAIAIGFAGWIYYGN